MSSPLRILLVEDSDDDAQLVIDTLTEAGFDLKWERVETEDAMRDALARKPWDAVLCDYLMPRFDAPRALDVLHTSGQDLPFIIVSGTVGEDTAVEAMRAGAHDYLMKDRLTRLAPAIDRELREAAVRRERRALETKLHEEEGRFRALVEKSSEVISVLDAEGRVIYVSPSATHVMGFDPAELMGRSAFDFMLADDLPAAKAAFSAVALTPGAATNLELRAIRRDGAVRWFDVVATNLLHVPHVQGVVINYHDITERKVAEEALRRGEAQLANAVVIARLGPWEYDVAADQFIFNDSFYTMLRTTAAKEGGYRMASARYAERFLPPEERALVAEEIRRALETLDLHFSRQIEHRVVFGDGRPGYLAVRFFVAKDQQGRTVRTYGVNQDITERKQAEADLKLFRALIDEMRDTVHIIDPATGRFIDVNNRSCRELGYTRKEMLTLSVLDITEGIDFAHFKDMTERLRQTGHAAFESHHRRRDGTTYPIEVSLSFVVAAGHEFVVATAHDITERQEAEAALRHERDLFNSLASAVPDLLYFKDRQSRFIRINDAMVRFFGLHTAAEAVGKTDFDFFTGEHARQAYESEQHVMQTGEPLVALEEKETWPDGRITWASSTKVPWRDPAGKIIGLIGVSRDITPRKQAEARSTVFSHLGQRLSVAIDGPAAARVIAAAADELLGWDACTFDLYFDRENLLQPILNVDLISGRRTDVTPTQVSKPPSPRMAHVIAQGGQLILREPGEGFGSDTIPFGDTQRPSAAVLIVPAREGARVVGVFSIQSYRPNAYQSGDLATLQALADHCGGALSRIQTTEVLRQTERKYRDLFENAVEGIFQSTPDAHLLIVNPACARLFGFGSPEEMLRERGTNVRLSYANPAERERFQQLVEQHGAVTNFELEARGRDGRFLWMSMNARAVRDDAGRVVRYEGSLIDITERKLLEEKLLRAQRLESLGMLAAGISHDLNNVLSPISMAVPLLRLNATATGDVRLLDTLEKCAERGSGLVKQILGFAHGIGGEPRVVQVKHLLRDIVHVVTETFPKFIRLDEQIPADLWPVVGNPTQIHQVLLNLCVNARDAMPDGGQLRLLAANCTLDAAAAAALAAEHPQAGARPGAWLMLHVEDSGTGIAPEVLAHIWEPFFTTKSPGTGTGLGLSTVRGIVATHGGFVTVRTELGLGTVFRVYLPVAENVAEPGAPAPAAAGASGHGEHILLVDDEELIRTTVTDVLEAAGFRVTVAADGAEAAAIFDRRSAEFALVVTDIDMPNLSGADLAHLIRSIRPDIRILAMSGQASRQPGVKPGEFADGFLPKPFPPEKLLDRIHGLLPQSQT